MNNMVPKIIHFIWAGGKKPLGERELLVSENWHKKNPDFQIWLWVDRSTTPGYVFEEYNKRCPWMQLKDITEEKMTDEYIRYEINRLVPNYGASSDLLRYKILYHFGGAYFDLDVHPGDTPLNNLDCFSSPANSLILLIDPNSQNESVPGNDTFICSPNHPIVEKMVMISHQNYTQSYDVCGNIVYDYEQYAYFKDSTIFRTGPIVVCEAFYSFGKLGFYGNVKNIVGMLINNEIVERQVPSEYHLPEKYIDKSEENTNSWLGYGTKLFTQKMASEEEAITSALNSILFEIEKLKLLRIDDHIKNIVESLGITSTKVGMPNDTEQRIAINLIRKLEENLTSLKILSKVESLQTISRYVVVNKFYEKNLKLLTIEKSYFQRDLFQYLTQDIPDPYLVKIMDILFRLEFAAHLRRYRNLCHEIAHTIIKNNKEIKHKIKDEKVFMEKISDFIMDYQDLLLTNEKANHFSNEILIELNENLNNLNKLQIFQSTKGNQYIKISGNRNNLFESSERERIGFDQEKNTKLEF